MNESLIIRRVRHEELHALLELLGHLHAEDAPLPEDDALQEIWQQILHDPKIHCLVGEWNHQLICSCTLTIIPNLTRGARPYALIENVVTHAAFRSRGIGSHLMRKTLQIAWDAGCYKVMLLSGMNREQAHAFYDHNGFAQRRVGFVARAPEA
jgi:GNAT superfamily N-acetyltransferase